MTSKATDQVRDFGLVSIAERLNDSVTEISHLGAPLLDLIIRLTLAVQFFRTGMLKTIDPEPTVWLFTFVHPVPGLSPESAAWLLTIAELVAPILILFGLATRIAALILLGSTALLHLAFPAVADHLYVMLLLGGVIIAGPKRPFRKGLSGRYRCDSRKVVETDLEPPCGRRPPESSIAARRCVIRLI